MKKYQVGGCVRDRLLGKPINDIDYVVVGSTAEEMLSLGFKLVGESFPVFLHPETCDEYALARTEIKTGKGYNGFDVIATPDITLETDCGRRDLTINSIAYDEETDTYIDPFGGLEDIKNKVLRHTSDAFSEDPLRVIRLARFFARYPHFSIAPETHILAKQIVHSGALNEINDERFMLELKKAFEQSDEIIDFFSVLQSFGVFEHVDFFINMFGHMQVSYNSEEVYFNSFAPSHLNTEEKLLAFICLVGDNPKLSAQVIPKHFKVMYDIIQNQRTADCNTNEMYKLLQITRGFDLQNNTIEHVKSIIKIGLHLNQKFTFHPTLIGICRDASVVDAETINSKLEVPLEGKALGDAIKDLRMQRMLKMFDRYYG